MSNALFSDTATLYHRLADGGYLRTVLRGVQWRQKIERRMDGSGKMQLATVTSVTIPACIHAEIDPGGQDVLVPGVGPVLTQDYTIAQLRRDEPGYCTIRAVSDSRQRPRLGHRRVTAV